MADLSKKPFLQQLRRILSDGIQRIDNDECDESSALKMVSMFNVESDKYYGNKKFVNYDKAMRIIGIRSRGTFKQLCDEHGIREQSIGSHKIGFLRTEIDELSEKLMNDKKKASK